MNQNDFYKELMSRYALNEDKIRLNALKQAKKPAWQRAAETYWKPAAGAAAAVAVTVAAVSYSVTQNAPSDIIIAPDAALSASQRLSEAEQNYYNLYNTEETVDIYVTFEEPISYNDIVMALSSIADTGDTEICAVYTGIDTVRGNDKLHDYSASHSDEKSIIGAKISAKASYYRDIQDLSCVYLAELGSENINDETFEPIAIEDFDPLINDQMSITTTTTAEPEPPVTTTPFEFDTTETTVIGSSDIPVIGDSEDDPDISVPTQTTTTTSVPDTEELSEATETNTTLPPVSETTTTTAAVEIPANEVTTTEYWSNGDSLLTEMYELNVENALDVNIFGNNVLVITKNAAYFYSLGGFGNTQNCTYIEIVNPKVSYSSNSAVILTGKNADETRSVISTINLSTNDVHTYDVSENIGSAILGSIHYSPSADKYYLKAVGENSTFVYEISLSAASGIQFRPLIESDGPVAIAGYKNDSLYLLKSNTAEASRLLSFNCQSGVISEIANFPENTKIKRGADLESFAIFTGETSFIYDVNTEMLVPVSEINESVMLMSDNGVTCFSVDGLLREIDASSSINASSRNIAFPSTSSSLSLSSITPEKVVITRSNAETDTSASWMQ